MVHGRKVVCYHIVIMTATTTKQSELIIHNRACWGVQSSFRVSFSPGWPHQGWTRCLRKPWKIWTSWQTSLTPRSTILLLWPSGRSRSCTFMETAVYFREFLEVGEHNPTMVNAGYLKHFTFPVGQSQVPFLTYKWGVSRRVGRGRKEGWEVVTYGSVSPGREGGGYLRFFWDSDFEIQSLTSIV